MPQRFRVYEPSYAHFVTSTVVHWIPVFSRDDYFRVLVDSLRYCVLNKGLAVHAYVLMPNHFHLVSSQQDGKLSDVMRDLKKHTSKLIAAKLVEDGRHIWRIAMERASGASGGVRVWDESFHPEQIVSRAFFDQKVAYIHNNPVRAGYVADPGDWQYSSAGFYYHDRESLVPITPVDI